MSEIVAARRALDLNLITRNEFYDFYNDYLKRFSPSKNETSGGDFYNNQFNRIGKRFANTVIQAVNEGSLLYRDAYKLTGLTAKTFDKFADKLLNS